MLPRVSTTSTWSLDADARARASQLAIADDFERNISTVVSGIAAAATELRATAETLTKSSSGTSDEAASVAAAAAETASRQGDPRGSYYVDLALGNAYEDLASQVTGLPIKLITTGERLEALEDFHPDRFASRVLGMGDVVTLVEKARANLDGRSVEDMTKRMRTGQFDLEDFLAQMDQMKKMGPLGGLLDMLPGAANIKKQLGGVNFDDGFFRQSEAIVRSMTLEERRHPEILNGSRRRRVARGSGTTPADVNRLLNQFKDARKLMQAMTSGKGAGGIMRMLGM